MSSKSDCNPQKNGGVLFAIVPMDPGFTVDEDSDELGTHLTLSVWLEDDREEIKSRLPTFETRPSKQLLAESSQFRVSVREWLYAFVAFSIFDANIDIR